MDLVTNGVKGMKEESIYLSLKFFFFFFKQ